MSDSNGKVGNIEQVKCYENRGIGYSRSMSRGHISELLLMFEWMRQGDISYIRKKDEDRKGSL
jgi:hypothetical protein